MKIDADTPGYHSESYTVLRIKRKRNEEPLDALVVESRVRKKKSRGGIGVFQFAQTVENDVWQDEEQQKGIQDQISRLARESSTSTGTKSTPDMSPLSKSRLDREELVRRYAILDQDDRYAEFRKPPTSPPEIISSKDLPRKKSLLPDFKMYDAVPAADKPPGAPPMDLEMANFLPMLDDYLKLHDIPQATKEATFKAGDLATSASKYDDYVWDVFYHRPATLSEWNEAANVGTLSGLPPSITDPYDSASESEEEDEADEDSNAEEYYKNDYPDEDDSLGDSAGSDAFHEDSDHDDVVYYDEDSDHDWR